MILYFAGVIVMCSIMILVNHKHMDLRDVGTTMLVSIVWPIALIGLIVAALCSSVTELK